jgi:hypothetical protein
MTDGKRGRFIRYDKQAVLQEIVDGKFSAGEIAERHNITRGMVYTLKYQARKRKIIRDPVPRLDDLDPVEPKTFLGPVPLEHPINRVFKLAQRYKIGDLSAEGLLAGITEIWRG